MRIKNHLAIIGSFWFLASPARGQGTFFNLDFESPILPLVPTNFQVPITNAMPGWTGCIGAFTTDLVVYDTVSLGAAAISIHDTNSAQPILQGNCTILLQGSFPAGAVVPAVGQMGTVPMYARSVTYYGQAPFTVTFAGQTIPVTAVGSGPNYTIFGGDISAFAGQTGELRFQGGGLLDNIFFSSTAIPEPNPLCLFALGLFLLASRVRTVLRNDGTVV